MCCDGCLSGESAKEETGLIVGATVSAVRPTTTATTSVASVTTAAKVSIYSLRGMHIAVPITLSVSPTGTHSCHSCLGCTGEALATGSAPSTPVTTLGGRAVESLIRVLHPDPIGA